MVERVVRAIFEQREKVRAERHVWHIPNAWETVPDLWRQELLGEARAAIEAMPLPVEALEAALANANLRGTGFLMLMPDGSAVSLDPERVTLRAASRPE